MDRGYSANAFPIPTTKRRVDMEGADFYPTPAWATHALCLHEGFAGNIWEPACGDGAMAEVLRGYGHDVYASDLYDRGYGATGIDFLKSERRAANIVTNPPYNSAGEFVKACISKSTLKFALLLRLAFLEGVERQKTIFNETPPSRIWIFSERITFYPKNAEVKGGGTTAYAWFVWDRAKWGTAEIKWLPAGYKAKYSGA